MKLVAAGNVMAPATNTLALFTTQFLPPQIANALANGYNPTVYAAESLGLALSSNAAFNTNYVSLSASAFVSSVAALTGLNANAISGWVANWTAFYTANPPAHLGLTVTQAAYGAAFGDAIGTALLNPTPISPANMPAGLPASPQFSTIQNETYNALKDNGEGTYVAGVAIGALPQETPLQGEAGASGVFLTSGIDSPTSGFSFSPTGTPVLNGFTATAAKTVFNAPTQFVGDLLVQTISTGDNLVDTAKDGTLGGPGTGNSALLIGDQVTGGVTNGFNFTGITTANLQAPNAGTALAPFGFQGSTEVGLTTVNNNASLGFIRLGGVNQGLGTVLTTYNSNNATQGFQAFVQASAFSATNNTITANLTGNLGAAGNGTNTGFEGTAIQLGFSPDTGASGYVNWNIMSNNNEFLILSQGSGTNANGNLGSGIGSAAKLVLTGAGNVELNALAAGDFANLKTVDGTAAGNVTLTGAAANTLGGYYSAVGIDASLAGFVNDAGFLTSKHDRHQLRRPLRPDGSEHQRDDGAHRQHGDWRHQLVGLAQCRCRTRRVRSPGRTASRSSPTRR